MSSVLSVQFLNFACLIGEDATRNSTRLALGEPPHFGSLSLYHLGLLRDAGRLQEITTGARWSPRRTRDWGIEWIGR